jgi:phosphoesterase RecJ-like protein
MLPEFSKINSLINNAERVLLLGHQNPDGDCLGAICALFFYLKKQGKFAQAVFNEELNTAYDYLPDFREIITTWENFNPLAFDLIIVLDASYFSRTGLDEKILSQPDRPAVLNLDHHASNDGFGDVSLVNSRASSTCEIIYDFFDYLNFPLTEPLATALLTGLQTDTGSFVYPNTTSHTLQIAAHLMRAGAQVNLINQRLFKNKNLANFKFLGQVLNQLHFNEKFNILSLVLTAEDLAAPEADFDGLTNFLQQIKEPEIIMVLKEQTVGEIKVSLRSKTIDVAAWAKKFGGGGHRRAAGFLLAGQLIKNEKGSWQVE